MATTGTYTARDLCTQALRKLGAVRLGQQPSGSMFQEALDTLNIMLKSWQNQRLMIWPTASQTVQLVAGQRVYDLDPARPLEIDNIQLNRSGSETPMWEMTREEYDTLPVKTSQGTSTTYYYDRQKEAAKLYVWPVPASVSGETLEITYIRELEDVEESDPVDVPGEWWETVVYNLADRMADTLEISAPKVTARATDLYDKALAFDRAGSVYFGDVHG